MPKIIVLAHQKGGVGKSTLSINLAHSFKDGVTTALVDLDRQGSVTDMADFLSGIRLVPYSKNIQKEKADFIIIDTPPYISDLLMEAFAIADLVLIPTQDGILDFVACRRTVDVVTAAMQKNKSLKAGIVLNMVKSGSALTNEAQGELEAFKIPVLRSRITHREDFKRSVALVDGIYSGEIKKSSAKARQDLTSLANEILMMLH